jgi:hypothetical protein
VTPVIFFSLKTSLLTYPEDSESVVETEEGFQGERAPFTANQKGEVVPLKNTEYSAPPKTAEDVFVGKAGPAAWLWLIDNGSILAAANEMGPEHGSEVLMAVYREWLATVQARSNQRENSDHPNHKALAKQYTSRQRVHVSRTITFSRDITLSNNAYIAVPRG